MFRAWALGFADLALPAVWRAMFLALALTAGLLLLLGAGIYLGALQIIGAAGWVTPFEGSIGAVLAALGMLAIGWLAFRTTAMAVIGLFADQIVAAVEHAHYPAAAATLHPVPATRSIALALRSAGRAIGWNALALPLYLLLLVTGVGAPVVFIVLNAYLLGRDLADCVEPRHPAIPAFGALARWSIGLMATGLLFVPFMNILVPAWSVTMATHRFHSRQR